jgi:hypothetical protein
MVVMKIFLIPLLFIMVVSCGTSDDAPQSNDAVVPTPEANQNSSLAGL